jgi:hypothetical protein
MRLCRKGRTHNEGVSGLGCLLEQLEQRDKNRGKEHNRSLKIFIKKNVEVKGNVAEWKQTRNLKLLVGKKKLKRDDHLKSLGVDDRIILEWNLKK